jgi:CRISPR-associated protein Cmr1
MYETRRFTVRFVTPAFLGNAEQRAQWRTPPFKALLRQWWRVAAAQQFNFDYKRLREEEAILFGHAWLENDRNRHGRKVNGRRSNVMIRLSNWAGGQQPSDWPGGQMEQVVTTKDGKSRVRSDLYLGYGAVLPPRKKEGRSSISLRSGAIAAGEENRVSLRFPDDRKLEQTLQLIGWFGSLGSRSRNGWGSLHVEGKDLPRETDVKPFCRPLSECMSLDWPHALGKNERGVLCWVTEPKNDWRAAMSTLAHIKVIVRAEVKGFRDPSGIGGPHLLGYPAGSAWQLREFPKEARLATQLRFKVLQTGNGLVGIVYHLPAKLPLVLRRVLTKGQKRWLESNELAVWEAVHSCLDNDSRIHRLA